VERDGDGLRSPHVPRPRAPLADAGRIPRDTQNVGPAESFRIRWREDAPGTWLYHCHVEDHMERGMVGIYRVARR
jgi:FtsP/CotA-like multicopper oxidase with cupredoxin domain